MLAVALLLLVLPSLLDARIKDVGEDYEVVDVGRIAKAPKRPKAILFREEEGSGHSPEAESTLPPTTISLTTLPSITSTGSDDSCNDILLCAPLSGFCKQSIYEGFVNVFCRKTCKLCKSSCFDHNPIQCQIWAEDGSCRSALLGAFASKMCAKSCNSCE
ncbi:hypothetical protein QR680_017327 [Steinernema hermaphroditum]|uniref:ShKT domain-containing protein n=1 Tax=Steinernema hermaphroditum TaxID=289476 RepID=A0AA39HE63_9BILA|nr:hypothetical protein QR680_017327 [Steinernema hermaphroditum]